MRTLSRRLALLATLIVTSQACHSRTPDEAAPVAATCPVSVADADAAAAFADRRLPVQRKNVIAIADCLRQDTRLTLNSETAVNILIFAGEQAEKSEEKLPYFQAAVEFGKQWTAKEPQRAESHIALARAYGSFGEAKGIRESLSLVDPIKKELETVIAIDPAAKHGLAFTILGRVYHKVPSFFGGDNEKAIETYRRGLATAPGHGTTLLFLAEVLAEEGSDEQNAEALQMLEQLHAVAINEQYPKDTAKELKQGGQLARRLGNMELSDKLKARSESIQ